MRIKVRAFASDRIHAAEVPDNLLVEMLHVGHTFTAVPLPAAMLCRAVLRKRYGYVVAVKMADDAKLNCPACKVATGEW